MLANPRYAALREYQGQTITGSWPAIIDADAHRSVLGVLSDPRRRKAGPCRRVRFRLHPATAGSPPAEGRSPLKFEEPL